MSDATEIVRRAYAAADSGDWETVETLVQPDVEFHPDSSMGREAQRGVDAVVEFFSEPTSMFEHFRIEPEEVREVDGRVLVQLHLTGSGSASGATFDIRIAHVWELREGLLSLGRGFA